MIEDGRTSPRPNYKFEQIKNKLKEMERNKAKQNFSKKGKVVSIMGVENLDDMSGEKHTGS